MKKAICKKSKNVLAKYLLGGVATGALALTPFAAQAQNTTMSNGNMSNNNMMMSDKMMASDPMMVTGTVENYWVDRAGYVSAMTVRTDAGVQTVRIPRGSAQNLFTNYPVGQPISVWVTPVASMRANTWDVRGVGMDRPTVWMPVNRARESEWLSAMPYITAGTQNRNYSGRLRGVVIDERSDILGLVLDTSLGRALVRVPPEVRHIAKGHIGGNERVVPLMRGAVVEVNGMQEAPRFGVLSPYVARIAANTIRVNGENAGAIGIQMLPVVQRRSLVNFNDDDRDGMMDANARAMGYRVYNPNNMEMMNDGRMNNRRMNDGMMSDGAITMGSTATQTATGRVMLVTADNQTLPIVRRNGRVWVTRADGSLSEIQLMNGIYVMPANMTGARMMMVMSDGSRMDMETVNGQMMVILPDGSKAPVTLHTP